MSHRNDLRRDATLPDTGSPQSTVNVGHGASRDMRANGAGGNAEDVELMRQIRARRQDAFEALYDRHAGHVYNLCRRVTGNDATAEEALIETFWEIWQRPDRYDAQRGTLLTYLLMLARCRSIDRRRGENAASQRTQPLPSHATTEPAARTDPAGENNEPIADGDVRHALLAAFDRLNPKCQDAVRLCVIQGLTTSEAAHALNVPLGTIKSRIRKSVIQMRRWLRTTEETSGSP